MRVGRMLTGKGDSVIYGYHQAIQIESGFAARLASDLAARDVLSSGVRCYLCCISFNILIDGLDKTWEAICCIFRSHEIGICIRDTLAKRNKISGRRKESHTKFHFRGIWVDNARWPPNQSSTDGIRDVHKGGHGMKGRLYQVFCELTCGAAQILAHVVLLGGGLHYLHQPHHWGNALRTEVLLQVHQSSM